MNKRKAIIQFLQVSFCYGTLMSIFQGWDLKTAVIGGASFGALMTAFFTFLQRSSSKGKAFHERTEGFCEKADVINVCNKGKAKQFIKCLYIFGLIFFGTGFFSSFYLASKEPRLLWLIPAYFFFVVLLILAVRTMSDQTQITRSEILNIRKSLFLNSKTNIKLSDISKVYLSFLGNIKIKTLDNKTYTIVGVYGDDYLRFGDVEEGVVNQEIYRPLYRLIAEIKRRVNAAS